MQPYLFPYIGYFQLISCADKFIIYDDVNYIKRGWINRNRILSNGTDYLFTAPVQKASQNSLIKDISLSEDPKWRKKLIRTIENAYRKAPHFDSVFPFVSELILLNESSIARYNGYILQEISRLLGIDTSFAYSSEIEYDTSLKGQYRILNVCQHELAEEYVNPINGKDLYDTKVFQAAGVNLYFIKPGISPYEQFNHEFIPGLSIIDYLMFLSVEDIRAKLSEFELFTKEELESRLR